MDDDDNPANYCFKEKRVKTIVFDENIQGPAEYDLQYFPASIIEKTDPTGQTHNDMRVFNPVKEQHDEELPENSYLKELRRLDIAAQEKKREQEAFLELEREQKGKKKKPIELPKVYGPKMLF